MSERFVKLQKALDKFPYHDVSLESISCQMNCVECDEWRKDFTKKFAAYRADLELPVGEWLTKNAKTTHELVCGSEDIGTEDDPFKKKWVSVDEIQPRLMKLVQERDDNKLLVIQAVTKLRAKEEQLEEKVLVERKQELLERALEIDNPSNDYGEVCKQNRQYRTLLKELLAGSVSLPLCERCKVPMKLLQTRDDGCRYFECPECGGTMGEETEEWFKEQGKGSTSEHKKEQTT